MNKIISRLCAKLARFWFAFCHRSSFQYLGQYAFLYSPYRIDTAQRIAWGDDSVMQSGGWLYCDENIGAGVALKVGKGCVFGYNNHITAMHDVTIGDYVLTANNIYISDNLHCFEDVSKPIMHQGIKFKSAVYIGDGTWLGENVCVIGARIGKGCVIGANAVVTSDIPDYSIAVGIPAVVIR